MAHTYSQFEVETVNGEPVQIPALEILRIIGSGVFRDGSAWEGIKVAGTITVGDVEIAGDAAVDLADMAASLSGALQGAPIDLAASTADQVLVAAPGANKQIWVYGLFMMADTAAGTVKLTDDDNTARSGTMAVSDEGGWVLPMSGNFDMPWFKCGTNKALHADTGACTIDGLLTYAVVTV